MIGRDRGRLKKGLIPPVTFGRRSGKFPSMKAWIYICAIVLVAGGVMVLAEEPKTNAAPGTAGPSRGDLNARQPRSRPTQIATAPRTPNAVTPSRNSGTVHKGALTNPPTGSTSAPAVANEVNRRMKPALTPTSAVPAEAVTHAAATGECHPAVRKSRDQQYGSPGHWRGDFGGGRRPGVFHVAPLPRFPHGSLITSAMNESNIRAKTRTKTRKGTKRDTRKAHESPRKRSRKRNSRRR